MKNGNAPNTENSLRLLPPVDAVLQTGTAREISAQAGAKHSTVLIRRVLASFREELREKISGDAAADYSREILLEETERRLRETWQDEQNARLRRVINATGVILHTNLGRAPLSSEARAAIIETASGYCNLEFNLEIGGRGRRGAYAERLLAELTGAGGALIVNNCAAAAFLVLKALANGGEAIISRGEMVEIGGDFRVPDVMAESGATLKEVGTTNRTRASDYEKAVNENTKIIVRVHPSNFRIIGFTAAPRLSELAELARRNEILLYEDAGSGAMLDLSKHGLTDEPVIADSIKAGADVVTFSGDKLLGGVQAGLIVGSFDVIEKLRAHQLYRALRAGKLIYAALEATLESFRRETMLREIPVLKMLSTTGAEIEKRATDFAEKLRAKIGENQNLQIEIVAGNSVIGGGSAPAVQPATTLIGLKHEKISVSRLEEILRFSKPPVIARILEDKVLIDLRTVSETEEFELLEILSKL